MLAVVLVGEWRWRGGWRGCWRGWWASGGGGGVGGTRGSCFNDVLAIPVAAADSVTVPDRVLCDLQTETGRHGECT